MGDHRRVTIVFPFLGFHSFFSCARPRLFSFSLASFFMPVLFSKHLCASAALSLPRHSWRSDRHGESVGQQPWNKYGWSWVRWARIICFAICLCESVDVMTVVLPSPVSPPLWGRRLTETHLLSPQNTRTHTHTHTHTHTMHVHVHIHSSMHTHTIAQRHTTTYTVPSQLFRLKATVHSSARTHRHNSTAVASPARLRVQSPGCGVCSTALPIPRASGPPWPLEMTGWQLPGRIGVGDCSAGSALPCDSLLVSVREEQHGSCVRSTLGIEGNKKLRRSIVTSNSPTNPALCPRSRQSSFFLGWLRRWGLVIVWVYVYRKKKKKNRKGKKKQAAELYIFLMEGDTVGALRINLDAWMES